jgi:hypothetical protein
MLTSPLFYGNRDTEWGYIYIYRGKSGKHRVNPQTPFPDNDEDLGQNSQIMTKTPR